MAKGKLLVAGEDDGVLTGFKDNLGTRFRVGLSVALLVGAKVIYMFLSSFPHFPLIDSLRS